MEQKTQEFRQVNVMGKIGVPKLCIVSPYSYPLFFPECRSPFGGAEVRVSAIARGLAARGRFHVSMIVWDHQQPNIQVVDGVKIYAWKGKQPPLKSASLDEQKDAQEQRIHNNQIKETDLTNQRSILRKIWKRIFPRWFHACVWKIYEAPRRIYQFVRDHPTVHFHPCFVAGFIAAHDVRRKDIAIYKKVNADIYMMAGNSKEAAELAFYCKQAGKKYVFITAHDADYDLGYLEKPDEVGVWGLGYLMTFSINNASLHIVQNEYQQSILQERYQRSSIVIRNPVDLSRRVDALKDEKRILWVGKSEWFKQPDRVLDAAEQCPQFAFTLILARVDESLFQQCVGRAKTLSNVEIIPYVPYQEVEKYFAKTRLLINTSVFEGFPNTFLQAAKYNVPVVSLQVDAGEMLSHHGCGFCCNGQFDKMLEKIYILMSDDGKYRQVSERCQDYLQKYHDKEKIFEAYENSLLSLV